MKSHEHQKAFNLYFQTDFTQRQIADMLDIDRKTLFTWAKEGGWKRAKHTIRHAPSLLSEQYYDQLAAINQAIAEREERPYPTKEEAAIIRTLTATLKNIGKRQTVAEVMEVFTDFELEVCRTDRNFAEKMIVYMDKYIQQLSEFDSERYRKKYYWERRKDKEYDDYVAEQEELAGTSNEKKEGENGEKMGSSSDASSPAKPATAASSQENNDISDEEKNEKGLPAEASAKDGGIKEKFQVAAKELKNAPLVITNCEGCYTIGIRNMEGRIAFTLKSDKPEETIDVSRLPGGKYQVAILDANYKVYIREVIIRN